MRLISLTLRNYRLHRDLTVEFDRARTLIGGPNESGKSTLVEALHRALFLSAKGTGDPHRVMKPFNGAHPEVELSLEAGGQTYQVHKRFSGQSGTTSLTRPGLAPLSGEAAETELARLLGVDGGVSAKAACGHWAHLWVWQGVSGEDPAAHANAQKDALIQRLSQADGAAALMQSETDARVAQLFAEANEANFKQGAKARAGSELAAAEDALAAAQAQHTQAQARLEALREALRTHAAASAALVSLEQDLLRLQNEQTAVDARARQLTELRRAESAQSADARAAEGVLADLQRVQEQITDLRTRLAQATAALVPQTQEIERLTRARDDARQASQETLHVFSEAEAAARLARQRHDLAAAHVALFDKRERHAELSQRLAQVQDVAKAVNELTATLSQLAPIERSQVQRLEKLTSQVVSAEAALHAMAAGIEVLVTDQPVRLGDHPLAAGQPQIITEDAELTIGAGTRLRIRPGGGTNLAEARAAVQDAKTKLARQLDELGVPSLEAATEILHRRADLAARFDAESKRLKDLNPDDLERKAAAAAEALLTAEADVVRRRAVVESPPPAPADPSAAQDAQTAAAEALDAAEAAEKRARLARDKAAEHLTAADTALARQHEQVQKQQRDQADFEAQLRLVLEAQGDDTTRAARLVQATETAQATQARLARTREAITALQPELLEADQNRLRRALEETRRQRQDAETQRAVAENTLRADGTTDPEADLALATANLHSVEQRCGSVRRRAQAIRLLHELFQQEQQVLADRFTRPLVEKVSLYLQSLFGAGARAEVRYTDGQFGSLHLIRPTVHNGSAIAFDSLSGGTKEQVATAMRLAMAEVLATQHDNTLPIVLDDAFANADPERLQTLQRMLDLAATRGLQVIVITCTPSDYTTLGARTMTLNRSNVSVSALRLDSAGFLAAKAEQADPVSIDESGAVARVIELNQQPLSQIPPSSSDSSARFLAALTNIGGSAGNATLRSALGWDETTYENVKDTLVTAGQIIRGKGRGGSVALATKATSDVCLSTPQGGVGHD